MSFTSDYYKAKGKSGKKEEQRQPEAAAPAVWRHPLLNENNAFDFSDLYPKIGSEDPSTPLRSAQDDNAGTIYQRALEAQIRAQSPAMMGRTQAQREAEIRSQSPTMRGQNVYLQTALESMRRQQQSPAMRGTTQQEREAKLRQQSPVMRGKTQQERETEIREQSPVMQTGYSYRKELDDARREQERAEDEAAVQAGKEAARLRAQYENMKLGGYDDPALLARVEELEKQAQESRQRVFDSKRNRYAEIINRADFRKNSGAYTPAERDGTNEIINSAYRENLLGLTNGEEPLLYLDDDERGIYNYLYRTQGKEAADEFLDFMGEELSRRAGAAMHGEMNLAQKIAAPAQAQVERFGQGFQTLLTGDSVTTTPMQYAAQNVRDEALWAGKQDEIAEYERKLAQYERGILKEKPEEPKPSALGRVLAAAVDLEATTVYMLPSILVSYLTGGLLSGAVEAGTISAAEAGSIAGIAGSATLGLSAGGNAMNEALKQGWTREQAGTYGLLVGASEAGLQYLLGGISKLGGVEALGDKAMEGILQQIASLENANARIALNFGTRLFASGLSEGIEEGLQEILEPYFKQMLRGEQAEVDLGEVAYSFLMGALSAGMFEAGDAWTAANMPTGFAESAGRAGMQGYFGPDGVDWFEGCTTEEEVRQRYRELAKQYHPDTAGENDAIRRINVQHDMQEAFFKGREMAQEASGTSSAADAAPSPQGEGIQAESVEEAIQQQSAEPETLQEAIQQQMQPEANENALTQSERAKSTVTVRSGESALDSKKGVAYTLASNIGKIEDMDAVSKLTGLELKSEGKTASEQIRDFFARIGNSVFRKGFGNVALNEYGVGGILTHRPLNRAKMVTLEAVPEVIKNGRLIQKTDNWKGRGYPSFVFAAPVEIAGERVYVAAVVDQRPDNKFYLNEVVDSKGNYVRIEETPSNGTKSGVTAQGGITATLEGVPGAAPDAAPDVTNIIPETGRDVNTEYAKEQKNIRNTQALPVEEPELRGLRLGEAFEENQNGGMRNGSERTEAAEPGQQRRTEGAPEQERGALPDADAGRRADERVRERAARIPEAVRVRSSETAKHRGLIHERQMKASLDPAVSPHDAGIQNGSEAPTMKLFTNEADWDPEIREGVKWARSQGVDVVPVLGRIQIEQGGKVGTADAQIDKRTGTIYVSADTLSASFSELLEHEVGHWKTAEENVRAFMNKVKRGKEAAWRPVYEAYRRRYGKLTDNFGGWTQDAVDMYVWEEILEDAYAEANRYGTRASVYGAEADAALGEGYNPPAAMQDGQDDRAGNEPVRTQETRGPPDGRYSLDEENRKEQQLAIIQRSNPAPNSYSTWVRSTEDIHTLEEAIRDPDWDYDEYDPDWTRSMAEEALKRGTLTVYSSYPIQPGVFVTPSREEAMSYAGAGNLYKKKVRPEDVAWIDPTQGQYAAVRGAYSQQEIQAVQSIPRKSLNDLTSKELRSVEMFARKYWQQMKEKSPFFRAWFGEWRANDQTPVKVADQKGSTRGPHKNEDTGWNIQTSGAVYDETSVHTEKQNTSAVPYLQNLDDVVHKAVLLDSATTGGKTKSENSLLMHSLYAVADIGNGPELLKLYVEEMNDPNSKDTVKRAYQLQNIERLTAGRKGSASSQVPSPFFPTASIRTIADLYRAVKQHDNNFNPGEASKITNDDGTPMLVYHGTNKDFNTFRSKDGTYWFSKSKDYAEAMMEERGGDRIIEAYLNMKNPMYATLQPGQFSDPTYERGLVRQAKLMGYDGLIIENGTTDPIAADTFYVAFEPEQIKSATENVGTFDGSNPDIRFSADEEAELPGLSLPSLENEQATAYNGNTDLTEVNDYVQQENGADRNGRNTALDPERQNTGHARGIQETNHTRNESRRYERTGRGTFLGQDSEGRRISPETTAKLEGTAIVDEKGQPLAVYHGTGSNFEHFERGDIGFHFGTREQAEERASKKTGGEKRIIRAYLNIRNPIESKRDLMGWHAWAAALNLWDLGYISTEEREEINKLRQEEGYNSPAAIRLREMLESKDYDGIKYQNGYEGEGTSYIAFHDDQIIQTPLEENVRYSASDDLAQEGYSSMDDYANRLRTEREQMRQETMRDKNRTEFRGTDALDKIGVRIAGSVGVYQYTDSIIQNARAERSIRRATRQAEIRLNASEAEKTFAHGVAAGIYNLEEVPASMDADKVEELADYYNAENLTKNTRLAEQRKIIHQFVDEKAESVFKEREGDHFKPLGMIRLNHGTPLRNMERMFGTKRGREIYDSVFRPVADNEAERIRFVNRMFDEVRTFEDSKGKTRELTKGESALVQQVIEGKAAGELAASLETSGIITSAAENIQNGMDAGDAAREFNLNPNERDLAQKLARWLQTQEQLKKADTKIIDAAVAKYQELYGKFYDAINDFLAAHGYEPIGFIRGYAPHMQPEETTDLLGKALKGCGINTEVTQLPASIAGRTAQFKPNKRWDPFFLSRTGDETEYDIVKGFERYVDYMSDVLYHTDDVMRLRAAERYFRKTFAPENTRNLIEQAEELRYASPEQKESFLRAQNQIDAKSVLSPEAVAEKMDEFIEKKYTDVQHMTRFSDLTMWLDNFANLLAGKQSMADRGREYDLGRKSLNIPTWFMKKFGQANVAGNISSALNQVAQWPMIQAEVGDRWTLKALLDVATGQTRRGNWNDESDFLTEKKGVEQLRQEPAEKVISAMFKPAELMDTLLSSVAVRGMYLKQIHAGKSSAEAMRAADDFGRAVMASRAKGSKPLTFHSKTLLNQMKNIFQIEALNSWEHITHDLGTEAKTIEKEQGKTKAAGWLAGVIVKALLGAFLLNRLTDELYGGTPAPFDVLGMLATFGATGYGMATNQYLETIIDNGLEKAFGERLFETKSTDFGEKEFDTKRALGEVLENLSNDVPFVRNVAGILGLGDQSVPMPQLWKQGKKVAEAIGDNGVLSKETGSAALDLAAELLPGGRQIRKTKQGLELVAKGGEYDKSGKLKYPAPDTPFGILQAALFGKYASQEAQAYFAGGSKAKGKQATGIYESLTEDGMSAKEAYSFINDLSGDGNMERYRYILDSDLTDEQKQRALGEIMGTEMTTEAGNPTQWAKLQQVLDSGFSLEDWYDLKERGYMNGSDYEKIIAGKEYGISVDMYTRAKEACKEIDENGTISQAEAEEAIGSLVIPTEQKAILWQMQNKSWKPERNPFDVEAGRRYVEAMTGEPTMQGLSLPRLEDTATMSSGDELRGLSLPGLN